MRSTWLVLRALPQCCTRVCLQCRQSPAAAALATSAHTLCQTQAGWPRCKVQPAAWHSPRKPGCSTQLLQRRSGWLVWRRRRQTLPAPPLPLQTPLLGMRKTRPSRHRRLWALQRPRLVACPSSHPHGCCPGHSPARLRCAACWAACMGRGARLGGCWPVAASPAGSDVVLAVCKGMPGATAGRQWCSRKALWLLAALLECGRLSDGKEGVGLLGNVPS